MWRSTKTYWNRRKTVINPESPKLDLCDAPATLMDTYKKKPFNIHKEGTCQGKLERSLREGQVVPSVEEQLVKNAAAELVNANPELELPQLRFHQKKVRLPKCFDGRKRNRSFKTFLSGIYHGHSEPND